MVGVQRTGIESVSNDKLVIGKQIDKCRFSTTCDAHDRNNDILWSAQECQRTVLS